MTYHSASCIVAGEHVTVEDGKAVAAALLKAFGFEDFEFRPDEKRSKYYIPDTQTEVYARHPVHGWVEVATFGMYSPSALAEYGGVGVPVMNLGLGGVERLAMIEYQANDVRQLTHPQFFSPVFSDSDLAAGIGLREAPPQTIPGILMAEAIQKVATVHAKEESPCSFEAWTGGECCGTKIHVFVEEDEENSRLCGPAVFNDIYVEDGKILGVPDTKKFAKVRENGGAAAGISYLEAVANLAAARIEEAACAGGEGIRVQVKMAKIPSDVNLKIENYVMRTITDNNKKTDVRGPIFVTVRSVLDG